ncbi:MAG TPA: sigma-70 family RNA polymerase sigma factor [Thermoanaerobaculia bacterium]|jgi:RNA polymerase sigma-70 factor (ECF subfamily)|nr:sigma-70 family RNA polymerase sigma factor [Thermoanaerobaculia bacterium]
MVEELFLNHWHSIRVFFIVRRFSTEEAEDLAQETFARVWRGIRQLEDEEAKEGWLYQIAKNIYKNHLRHRDAGKRKGRELPLDDREGSFFDLPDPEIDPLADLLEGERAHWLRAAIESLPKKMSRVVLLYLDGQSYGEIAALLLVSEETVRAHLFQARRRLRDILIDPAELVH